MRPETTDEDATPPRRCCYLSPKTIEMHLRNAYRKLDIPDRRHLAAALR